MVTKTLSGASQHLLHFSIVLVSVYVCLAVAAVLLFGEDVEEFATLDRFFAEKIRWLGLLLGASHDFMREKDLPEGLPHSSIF